VSLDTGAILAELRTEAKRLGKFDKVRGHEAKNPPGIKLSLDQWVRLCRPIPNRGGLATTTALLVVDLRIYNSMTAKPEDDIDPTVCAAADAIVDGLNGNFTLGGLVSNVDIKNAHGGGFLGWTMGYIRMGSPGNVREYRAAVVTVPMVINDAWAQAATR
jgi:hypothetical protein